MEKNSELNLRQFTGTTQYFRMRRNQLITDGVEYLCRVAYCYTIVEFVFNELEKLKNKDWFVLIKVTSEKNFFTVACEDGNDFQHSKNSIHDMKAMIPNLTLYASWDGTNWVLMLPSEY